MSKFEDDLDELERVVEKLERGELSLEENVELFEKGVVLARSCRTVLSRLEARIEALVNPEQEGPVRVEELALAVADEEEEEGEDDPSF